MGKTLLDLGIVDGTFATESHATQIFWVKLILLANHTARRNGRLEYAPGKPYSKTYLCLRCCLSSEEYDIAMRAFLKDKRVHIELDGTIVLTNWSKYQKYNHPNRNSKQQPRSSAQQGAIRAKTIKADPQGSRRVLTHEYGDVIASSKTGEVLSAPPPDQAQVDATIRKAHRKGCHTPGTLETEARAALGLPPIGQGHAATPQLADRQPEAPEAPGNRQQAASSTPEAPTDAPALAQPGLHAATERQDNGHAAKPKSLYPTFAHVRQDAALWDSLKARYPGLDLDYEADRCEEWCRANGRKVKSAKLTLQNWLHKAAQLQELGKRTKVGRYTPEDYTGGKYAANVQR